MSETATKLIAAVLELPADERVAVKQALELSLAADEPDAEFDATIAERVAEIRSGKVVGVPGDEFMERLRKKYQK
jgi:putative addiction module component (TIGR02574 family)